MEKIHISSFQKFDKYPPKLLEFIEKYKIRAPKVSSLQGQCISLMCCKVNRNKYLNRNILEKYLKFLEKESKDVIQLVNKCEQWGLKRGKLGNDKYFIPYPFEYVETKPELRKSKKIDNFEEYAEYWRMYYKKNYVDIPIEKWQVGHKNPEKGEDDNNLIPQPPIQAKYRDRFIFVDPNRMMPTPKEFKKNYTSYYTKKQCKELYKILKVILE